MDLQSGGSQTVHSTTKLSCRQVGFGDLNDNPLSDAHDSLCLLRFGLFCAHSPGDSASQFDAVL